MENKTKPTYGEGPGFDVPADALHRSEDTFWVAVAFVASTYSPATAPLERAHQKRKLSAAYYKRVEGEEQR